MAKATGNEFAVGVLVLESAEFRTAIKAEEKVFAASTQRMQTSANKVSSSTAAMGKAGFDGAKGIGAMSQSAALLSGSLGGMVSRGVAAIQMFQLLTISMKATSLAFAATGIGLLLVVITFREEIIKATEKGLTFMGFMADLTEITKAQAKAMSDLQKELSFDDKLDTLRDKFKNVTGAMTQQRLEFRALLRGSETLTGGQADLLSQLAANIRMVELKKQLAATEAGIVKQVAELVHQEQVLLGLAGQFDNIEDERLRNARESLALAGERAAVEREIAAEKKAAMMADRAQLQTDQARIMSLSRQLLIQAGLAKASEFEENPVLRRLLEISEALGIAGPASATAVTGATGGLRNARLGGGVAIATQIGNRREETKIKLLVNMDKMIQRFVLNQSGMGDV